MRELIAASTERTLNVVGAGEYPVPPPPLGAALTVLTMHSQDEDEPGDAEALREVCADWLPLVTQSVVFSGSFSEERRRQVLFAFVRQGIPQRLRRRIREERESAEEAVRQREAENRSAYWHARVAQYRSHFGLTWQQVMEESFYSFVVQLAELRRLEARQKRRAAEAGMIAQSGDKDAYQATVDRSTFPGHDDEEQQEVEKEYETPEEKEKWVQKKLAKVHEIKQRTSHRGQNDV